MNRRSTPRVFRRSGETSAQSFWVPLDEDSTLSIEEEPLHKLVNSLKKPAPHIEPFSGEDLSYTYVKFRRQFSKLEALCEDDDERFNFLERYTTGEAKTIVNGFSHLDSKTAFEAAFEELKWRYGDPEVVASNYIRKALNWDKIPANDPKALDKFSTFLTECFHAAESLQSVQLLDYPDNLRKLMGKLPGSLQEKWRNKAFEKKEHGDRATFGDFVAMIKREARKANDTLYGFEACKDSTERRESGRARTANPRKTGNSFATVTTSNDTQRSTEISSSPSKCPRCDGYHALASCMTFVAMSSTERNDFCKQKGICFGCLKKGHIKSKCMQKMSCDKCGKLHPSLLHFDKAVSAVAAENSCTLAIIPVTVSCGTKCTHTYAFLDPGSTLSFCTNELAQELGMGGAEVELSVSTMGGNQTFSTSILKGVKVSPLVMREAGFQLSGERFASDPISISRLYTIPSIPVNQSHIPKQEDVSKWQHLDGIVLPQLTSKIGLLLGNREAEAYTPLELRTGPPGSPHAIRTKLGWTLWNVVRDSTKELPVVNLLTEVHDTDGLIRLLKKTEQVDFPEIPDRTEASIEDGKFLKKMKSMTLVDGHYTVGVPLRDGYVLPPSELPALQRLESLRRKFIKDPEYRMKYAEVMKELLSKGYAEEATNEPVPGKYWYLPHHGVPKKDSVRIVYDGAAKAHGIALNEAVLPGPDLTSNLLGVLLRFRQDRVAVKGDIEGMFHQVRVPPEDRDLFRFLWWPDGNVSLPPKAYRMTAHVFGCTSSPGCANFAVRKTAEDNSNNFSEVVVKTLLKIFYVDDVLKSVATVTEAAALVEDLIAICKKGGFRLTKWASNSKEVIDSIPVSEKAGSKEVEKALGVLWNTVLDVLSIRIDVTDRPCTKRGLLGMIASTFDPLGIASPFVLTARLILKELFTSGIGWDDSLEVNLVKRVKCWENDLRGLTEFHVPRCYRQQPNDCVNTELHVFCDASESAYGVSCYLRFTLDDGSVETSLVLAKSRVTPQKKVTIPRLELTAALMGVRLHEVLLRELEFEIERSILWTDSSAVLGFISNETRRQKTFVANRVAEIRSKSDVTQWRHVNGVDNPADLASRGCGLKELSSSLWLEGPTFLKKPETEWPVLRVIECEEATEEVYVTCEQENPVDKLLNSFSSYSRLKGAVRVLLLFKSYLKAKCAGPVTSIDSLSIVDPERAILTYIQRKHFGEGHTLTSKLKSVANLDPFVVDGLIRVGGRLRKSKLALDSVHPVLVPKESPVAALLCQEAHTKCGHMGTNFMVSWIRRKFWIPKLVSYARGVASKCVTCRKYAARVMQQKMADLPEERVIQGEAVFSRVGIDCFGPIEIKRGRVVHKRWGLIITCLATRAIHLEVLSSMDTDSCINGLRRFIARRGQVKYIRSDNGTNFIGAEKQINPVKLSTELVRRDIVWEFNPPSAPHFGGVWERMIRTVKKILHVTSCEQTLTEESLHTLFCEAEAIVNSRPITRVSEDPNDLRALSPMQLLTLKGDYAVPQGTFSKDDNFARRRWRQVQYLADIFWKRWVREYLPLLQLRQKWLDNKRNLKVGDVVVVVDGNKRSDWAMGKVVGVYSDRRGVVRSAEVKTTFSVVHRPICKLSLLLECD